MPEYPSRIFQGFNPAGPACPVCDPRPIIEAEKAHRERVNAMEQVDA